MAAPSEKLAASLEVLADLQHGGRRVFRTPELSRVHRERLVDRGFLQPVIQGWLISSQPRTPPGDTTPWHASFWEFCARYGSERFDDAWHLSPGLSILRHAEATAIPRQVVLYSPSGTNNVVELLFDTSLYDLRTNSMPATLDLVMSDGLRLYTPAAALTRVPQSFFKRHPVEARVALATVADASDVLRPLLEGGHSSVAGRLAAAFRRCGRAEVADDIVQTMRAAGYDVREADPFASAEPTGTVRRDAAAIVRRVDALWTKMRPTALDLSPAPPKRPPVTAHYLAFVDDVFLSDAYHSLSIEGYNVTPELVERVRAGNWMPDRRPGDRDQGDALAARGYWQAFALVKESIANVLDGANPGTLVRSAHRAWYRELFQPFIAAGLLPPAALAGYRDEPVYLMGSRHVPPRAEAVRDAMPALFDKLEEETDSFVRAVLGHWMLGYIHPYPDGNGRIARFLMNTMLASGGYPWTVIRVDDRKPYLAALETASVEGEIESFARFVADRVRGSMEEAETRGAS